MIFRNMVGLLIVLAVFGVAQADNIADFDDLTLDANDYWNGSDDSGDFISGEANFNNTFTDWGGGYFSWAGFAYSNIKDSVTAGWDGEFNAITGSANSSDNYAIGTYLDIVGSIYPVMTLDQPAVVGGLYVTNNNWAYYSMLNGDSFAKKFGGQSGNDEDWFVLTITGKDELEIETGSVDFYLADYRFADNSLDYIVNDWQFIDLTSLGTVKSLQFSLDSSDVGAFGINTPMYFAMDTIVPEPTPLMRMIDHINEAIALKSEAIEVINEALEEELAALENLGQVEGLKQADVQKSKARLALAITRERLAKRKLAKSIDDLEQLLKSLSSEESDGQKSKSKN